MKGIGTASAVIAFVLALPTVPAAVAQVSQSYDGMDYADGSFFDDYISERLTVGLRVSTFRLRHADRPPDRDGGRTFVGYINKLEEEDDVNFNPTVTWWIARYAALELTWDGVEASTWNYNLKTANGKGTTDGNIKMSGPILGLRLQYPLFDLAVTPYVGIGYAKWSTKFERSREWAREGPGKERIMDCDDDSGIVWTLGVGLRPIPHCEVDLMVRKLDLTSDAEFWYGHNGHKTKYNSSGDFNLDHVAYGAAVSYVF